MRFSLALIGFATAFAAGQALAQTSITIGVMTDLSGLYADFTGNGSVEAARMAVQDFTGRNGDIKVTLLSADHQNKPDIGSAIARKWYDADGVDVIVDVPQSSIGLAVAEITREKNKVFLATAPTTSDLTGSKCSPNTVHWTYDTWAFAHGTGGNVARQGGDSWFFLTADYAYGHSIERETAEVVRQNGGKVVGSVKVPLNNADFSSFLLQAQASKAKIIGLANAGGDTINAIKQAAEFGITEGGQKLVGLAIMISDVHGLGLQRAKGLVSTTAFYWDLNDRTRAFAKRFAERMGGRYPTQVQAGVYSSTLRYLDAVKGVGSAKTGTAVVAAMGKAEFDDPLFGRTWLRKDGRVVHAMHLFEVKDPAESKGPYDYYKILATIPPEEAFRPLREGGCPLVE